MARGAAPAAAYPQSRSCFRCRGTCHGCCPRRRSARRACSTVSTRAQRNRSAVSSNFCSVTHRAAEAYHRVVKRPARYLCDRLRTLVQVCTHRVNSVRTRQWVAEQPPRTAQCFANSRAGSISHVPETNTGSSVTCSLLTPSCPQKPLPHVNTCPPPSVGGICTSAAECQ